jgi:flagellar biosynthetic protein FlhB
MSPADLLSTLAHTIITIARRAALAYLVIAALDYLWQRHRHEKSLKMSKEDVKEESKSQNVAPEVRAAIRRRQIQAARARMMAAVPQADVVVTNPTHFAVALAYDGRKAAPEVIAKGPDLIAFHIRRIAEEHGVPIVEDPPLARALHASVEVGQEIPEEFFQAVAQLLAFVYRVAGRRAG